MRRRPRCHLVASLVALALPMTAAPRQPDVPEAPGEQQSRTAVEPDRTDEHVSPLPGDGDHDHRASVKGESDPPAREGAASMEPDPRSKGGDEVKEDAKADAAEQQHRRWLESIWTSP